MLVGKNLLLLKPYVVQSVKFSNSSFSLELDIVYR